MLVIDLLAGILFLVMALMAWRRRDFAGQRYLALLALSIGAYELLTVAEGRAFPIETKILLLKLEFIGIVLIGPLFLLLALDHVRPPSISIILSTLLVPVLTLLLTFTNDAHHLMWSDVRTWAWDDAVYLRPMYGPWFWFHTGYSVALGIGGAAILLFRARRWERTPRRIMVAFVGLSVVTSIAVILYLLRYHDVLPNPAAFSLIPLALLYFYNLRRGWPPLPRRPYASIEEPIPDGLIVVDRKGIIVEVNPAAEKMLQRAHEDLIGRAAGEVLADRPEILAHLQTISPVSVSLDLTSSPEGAAYEVTIAPIQMRKGRIEGHIITLHDITARQRLENQLKEHIRHLETLRDLSERLSPLLDVQEICETVTRTLNEVTRYKYSAIYLLDPETGERVLVSSAGVPREDLPRRMPPGTGVSEYALKSGKLHYTPDVTRDPRYVKGLGGGAEVDAPIFAHDQVYGVLIVENDVPESFTRKDFLLIEAVARQVGTSIERALAHRQVREAEARYRELFNSMPVGLYRTTPDGRILEASPALARLLGYPDVASLLMVNAFSLYVDPQERHTWTRAVEADKGTRYHVDELRLRRLDGTVVWVRDVGRVVRDEEGNVLYYDGYLEDITEEVRRRQEQEAFIRRVERQYRAIAELLVHPAVVEGDIETALKLINTVAAETLQASMACVYRLTERPLGLRVLDAYERETEKHLGGRFYPLERPLFPEDVSSTRRIIVIPDALSDPLFAPIVAAYGPTKAPAPALASAIHVRGRVIGIFGVHLSGRPREWTEDEKRFISELADIIAQVFLNAEIRHRAEQLRALNETLMDITSEQNPSALLNKVVERAVPLTSATSGVLLLHEPDQRQLRIATVYNYPRHLLGKTIAYGEGAAGWVVQTGKPLIVDDYATWKRKSPLATGTYRSVLTVPVTWHDQIMGVLQVLHEDVGRFTAENEEILTLFARQVAIALHNAQLLKEERRRTAALQALHEASLEITSTLDLQTVLARVLRTVVDFTQAEDAHFFLYDGERLHFGAAYWAGEIQKEPYAEPREHDATYTVARTGEPLIIPNVNDHPLYQDWQWNGALASLPLKVGDRVVGVMNVAFTHPHPFDETEVRFLELFADQAAIAIENARLVQEVEQRARDLDFLRKVLESLNASPHIREAFHFLGNLLMEMTQANRISLALIEDGGEAFSIHALYPGDEVLGAGTRMPISATSAAADVLAGRIHLTPDLSRELDTPGERLLYKAGVRSRVNIPIRVGKRAIGALNLTWPRENGYREEQLPLLQQVADALALAVERSRLLETTERQANELEILYRTALALGSILDVDALLDRLAEEITHVLEPFSVGIFTYDARDEAIDVLLAYEGGQRLKDIEGMHVPLDEAGLTGWLIRSRQSMLIRNLEEEMESLPVEPRTITGPSILSWIGVPLVMGDRLIGAMSVQSTRAYAFDDHDLRFLELLAPQVALALENARLYQAERGSRERAERLFQAAQALSATLDLQEVLERILSELRNVVPYNSASVQELRGNDLVIIGGHGFPNLEELLGIHFPLDSEEHPNSVVIRECRPLILEDAWNTYAGFRQGPHAAARIRSWLGVPMVYGDRVVGMIALDKREPHFYTEEHARAALAFAAQAAIAIENARLYTETRRLAERRAILHQASQEVMFAGIDREKVFHIVHRAAGKVMSAEAFVITLVDWEHLAIDAVYLVDKDGRHAPMRVPITQGFSGYVLRTGESIVIRDTEKDLPALGITPVHFGSPDHVRSLVMVPIRFGDRILGTLSAQSYSPAAYGEEERVYLEMLAATVAGALETARLFEQIQEQSRRIQRIVDTMPEGVILLNADLRVIVTNPRGEEYLTLLNPSWRSEALEWLGDRPVSGLLSPAPPGHPHEVRTNDGRVFEVVAAPLGEEQADGWVVLLRDVTQEREVQKRIQQHERLASLGEMAAGIAHDFNNILQGLVGYATLLARRSDIPEDARERLRKMAEQGNRGVHLVRQILDFSRTGPARRELVDLGELVREIASWIKDIMPSSIQVSVNVLDGAYPAQVDPTQMQQVLVNLVNNARDAMPEGGTVEITLRRLEVRPGRRAPLPEMRPGTWYVLTVSDTGQGIPDDVLPHIFEPFFTTKDVGKGVGLGLAQVYGIIQQHDGHITVKSRVGKGTTFFIYLPGTEPSPPEKPEPQAGARAPTESPTYPRAREEQPRVLLITQDKTLWAEVRQALIAAGYVVISARTGEQVLHAYRAHGERLRAIIVDVTTDKSVRALVRTMEFRTGEPPIPLIALVRENATPSHEVLEGDHVTWVHWPCSVEDLRLALENAQHAGMTAKNG